MKVFVAGKTVFWNRSLAQERNTDSTLTLSTYFLDVCSEYIEDSIIETCDVDSLEIGNMIEDTLEKTVNKPYRSSDLVMNK